MIGFNLDHPEIIGFKLYSFVHILWRLRRRKPLILLQVGIVPKLIYKHNTLIHLSSSRKREKKGHKGK